MEVELPGIKKRHPATLLERAIAVEAHEGHRDAEGRPYLLHALRVKVADLADQLDLFHHADIADRLPALRRSLRYWHQLRELDGRATATSTIAWRARRLLTRAPETEEVPTCNDTRATRTFDEADRRLYRHEGGR
jgi:hypothetical protein